MSSVCQYTQLTQSAPATIKSAPGFFRGFLVVSSTSGSITVYDNTSATGTVLYSKSGLTAGEAVDLDPIQVKVGLHVVIGGTATVNVLFS